MLASDILDPPPSPSIGSRHRAPKSALAAPAMTSSWDDEVQATISKYSGASVHAAQEPEGSAAPSVESDLGRNALADREVDGRGQRDESRHGGERDVSRAPRAAAGVADCECAEPYPTDPALAKPVACADACAVPSRRASVDAGESRSIRRYAAAARHHWARLARPSYATGGQ